MAIYRQPVTNLQNQQTGLTATNKQLTSIQSELQTLSADALAVGDPTLFETQQAVTSSDTTRVRPRARPAPASAATRSRSAAGQLGAGHLRAHEPHERTTASRSTAARTRSSAGESVQDFVDSINSDTRRERLRRRHQLRHRGVLLPPDGCQPRACRSPTPAGRWHCSRPRPGRTHCSAWTASTATQRPTPSPTRSGACP